MGKASPFVKVLRAGYLSSLFLGMAMLLFGGLLQPYSIEASTLRQGDPGRVVYVAPFKLPITPISAQYFDRLVKTAEDAGADALVVQIDTPGGLVDSMQEIMKRILASRVPVIAYVSPQGAQSASAGVFIVYASHFAAMAPNTTIGSAEVIFEGDSGGGGGGSSATPETGNEASMRRKVTNELVSKIRNLAVTRGRNPDFAEGAVRESRNLGAQDALKQNVVNVIANNIDDLLNQADGKTVTLESGQTTFHTKGATIRSLSISFGEEILLLITNPSVAFVLISLGTLGVTWEFINPGAVFPGVVGAILLLVGFLGLGTLPISAAGIVFLVLAFVLFIADIFMPSHGILTAGGIASLVLGGLLLINTEGVPGVPSVSPVVVAGVAAALGGFFFYAVYKVFQARRYRPATGRERLIGSMAEARTDLAPNGMVFVEGELWNAVSPEGPVLSGRKVRVLSAQGLTLTVAPDEA